MFPAFFPDPALFNQVPCSALAYSVVTVLGLVSGCVAVRVSERLVAKEETASGLLVICRDSGFRSHLLYLVGALVGAMVYLSLCQVLGFTLRALERMLLLSLLMCAAITDLFAYIIPDGLVILVILIRLFSIGVSASQDQWVGIGGDLASSVFYGFLIAAPVFLLALTLERVSRKSSIGGGDVKLLFATGMHFGWQENLLALLAACFTGIIFAGLLRRKPIPFGVAIAVGFWIVACSGTAIMGPYV